MSTTKGGGEVVKDNLVFYVDGANIRTYDANKDLTKVSDLVNNSIGSLVNGTSYDESNKGIFVLDGTNDYINCGDFIPKQNLTYPYTIECWVKPDISTSNAINTKGIFSPACRTGTSPYFGVFLQLYPITFGSVSPQFDGNYQLHLNTGNGGGIGSNNRRSFKTLDRVCIGDSWNHIVGIVRSQSDFKIYVNGVYSHGTIDGTGSVLNWGTNTFSFIGDAPGNAGQIDGTISNVKFYNSELTDSEIKQNFDLQKRRFNITTDIFEKETIVGESSIVSSGLVFNFDASNNSCITDPLNRLLTDTTLTDLTGNNDGTIKNGVVYNYNNGGSLEFDGYNDRVECGTGSTLDITSGITLECVFNAPTNTQNAGVISKWVSGAETDNSYLFYLGNNSATNRMSFALYDSVSGTTDLTPAFTYSKNQWYHVVCTWDGSTMKMYINNVLQPETTSYNGTIQISTRQLTIGTLRESDFVYPFNGRIAISRVYNRGLDTSEVLQNYNSIKNRFNI